MTTGTTETRPIPAIGMTAYNLLTQGYKDDLTTISVQTLESAGLVPSDGWRVNWSTGELTRTIAAPDADPPPDGNAP